MTSELRITVDEAEGGTAMAAAGTLSAGTAGPLLEALRKACGTGGPAVLDLTGITGLDLRGLELVCSAHRTVQRRGSTFALGRVSNAVIEAARDAGYDSRTSVWPYRVGEDCMWRFQNAQDNHDGG